MLIELSFEVWAESIRSTIGRNWQVLRWAPFSWSQFMQDFLYINEWMWGDFGLSMLDIEEDTNLPKFDALSKGHDEWITKVQKNIPAESLLVFKAIDGWEPLCTFLSKEDELVKQRCDEILASGEEYPNLNDSTTMKINYAIFTAIAYLWWLFPLLVMFGSWYCYKRCCKKDLSKEKSQ